MTSDSSATSPTTSGVEHRCPVTQLECVEHDHVAVLARGWPAPRASRCTPRAAGHQRGHGRPPSPESGLPAWRTPCAPSLRGHSVAHRRRPWITSSPTHPPCSGEARRARRPPPGAAAPPPRPHRADIDGLRGGVDPARRRYHAGSAGRRQVSSASTSSRSPASLSPGCCWPSWRRRIGSHSGSSSPGGVPAAAALDPGCSWPTPLAGMVLLPPLARAGLVLMSRGALRGEALRRPGDGVLRRRGHRQPARHDRSLLIQEQFYALWPAHDRRGRLPPAAVHLGAGSCTTVGGGDRGRRRGLARRVVELDLSSRPRG